MLAENLELRPILREPRDSDMDLVIGSWLRSYRKHAPLTLDSIYYPGQRKIINDIMINSNNRLLVCASSEYDDAVLGWCCADPVRQILHYCHVKEPFRRLGIATMLLDVLGLNPKTMRFSHITRVGQGIMNRYKNYNHDPWSLINA